MRYACIAGAVAALAFGFIGVAEGQDSGVQVVLQRPRLGVTVDIKSTTTDGAVIEAVTPGGPADRAGIRSGDVILRLNGQLVVSSTDRRPPGLRLIGIAARLEPNDTVPVELRRGTQRRKVSLVTTPEPNKVTFQFTTDTGAAGMQRLYRWISSPLAALETAPLNNDLGQYFGTTEGVLVIKSPASSAVPLKGGDVILTVDGRKPIDPAHLMRMLQVQPNDQPRKLEIMRHRKRMSVTLDLKGDRSVDQRSRKP